MNTWKNMFGRSDSQDLPATLDEIRKACAEPGDEAKALSALLVRAPDLDTLPGAPEFPIMLLPKGAMIVSHHTFPLILAAMLHKPERLRALLGNGARTDVKCAHGRTALHWAIAGEADSQILASLIFQSESPEAGAKSTAPQPSIAADQQAASLSCTRILLEQGAEPNVADNLGHTPLSRACTVGGKAEHIRLLLAHGASVAAQTSRGVTPLTLAVQNGLVEAVQLILAAGGNPKMRDIKTATPLHWACAKDFVEIARILLRANADPTAADGEGHTPVSLALASGSVPLIRLFQQEGASMALPSGWQQTLLVKALGRQDVATIEALLAEFEINQADEQGITLLHKAVAYDVRPEIISLLLSRGANIETADKHHRRALHIAALQGVAALIPVLVRHGADIEAESFRALHFAAMSGQLPAALALLDAGANPHALDESYLSPLAWAVKERHAEVAKALLDRLEPHGSLAALPGLSPLIIAAQIGDVDIARMLLQNKPDLNATTDDGWTALHEAVAHGPELVQLMLDAGVNPNAPSEAGYTALHRAAAKGRADIVTLLLRHSADRNAVDLTGNTLAHFAHASGNDKTTALVATLCGPVVERSKEELQNEVLKILAYHIKRAPRRMVALRKFGRLIIAGGDGSAEECPLVVHLKGIGSGIVAIYEYLDTQFGHRIANEMSGAAARGWKLDSAVCLSRGDRHLNRMNIFLPDGAARSVYFDITKCAPPGETLQVLLAHAEVGKAG